MCVQACLPVCDGRSRPEGKSLRHGACHSREHTTSPALLLGRRLSRCFASGRRTAIMPCSESTRAVRTRGGKSVGTKDGEKNTSADKESKHHAYFRVGSFGAKLEVTI